jgi:hypothetical protein
MGTLYRDLYTFIISLSVLLGMRIFQTKVTRKINIHTRYFKFPELSIENLSVYGEMWKDTVEPGRPQMTG